MLLKLKQESSGYSSWVQSEADNDKYIEEYRRAEGISLNKASISNKCRANEFGETIVEFDVGKMRSKLQQNPNKTCDISESVIRASHKSMY